MITEIIKIIRIKKWQINNLENALKNNEIEKNKINIVKKNIEEKKENVKRLKDYINLII